MKFVDKQSNTPKNWPKMDTTSKIFAKLQNQLKFAEGGLNISENLNLYYKNKNHLELIYDQIADDVRIRTKYDLYEQGENSP